MNRKLQSVAGTLHDGIEPALQQPGQVEPIIDHFLPGLVCVATTPCSDQELLDKQHVTGVVGQEGYYVRFLNRNGAIVATAGQLPVNLPVRSASQLWQTLEAADGMRYRQISLLLKTQNQDIRGYIQVGVSLQEYEAHLVWLRSVLLLGLPSAMLLVALASWWLAGLAMQPVYQSYHEIQQFTADAAHELRTPIAAIQAAAEFTLEEPEISEAEARQTLHTITRQNHRLLQLVQDLLLLSRMDLQSAAPARSSCCLNEIVHDLSEGFTTLATAANVKLLFDIQTTESLKVWGDEAQLYRLCANLITNAIHYTPAGGQVTIELVKEQMAQAHIRVSDTGIGIAQKDQPLIFERFYRVSRDRSRQAGGTGLGLSIAKAIAQAHQGSIQVHSELGKGSVFSVRLPLKLS